VTNDPLDVFKIETKVSGFETDTAIKLIMLDNLQRIKDSLQKLSEFPMTKKQAE